jgi:hypothetical protein
VIGINYKDTHVIFLSSYFFLSLNLNILLSTLILNTLGVRYSLTWKIQVNQLFKTRFLERLSMILNVIEKSGRRYENFRQFGLAYEITPMESC